MINLYEISGKILLKIIEKILDKKKRNYYENDGIILTDELESFLFNEDTEYDAYFNTLKKEYGLDNNYNSQVIKSFMILNIIIKNYMVLLFEIKNKIELKYDAEEYIFYNTNSLFEMLVKSFKIDIRRIKSWISGFIIFHSENRIYQIDCLNNMAASGYKNAKTFALFENCNGSYEQIITKNERNAQNLLYAIQIVENSDSDSVTQDEELLSVGLLMIEETPELITLKRKKLNDALKLYYKDDDIEGIYSFLFVNVYESIKCDIKLDISKYNPDNENGQEALEYLRFLEKPSTDYSCIKDRFDKDDDFFSYIIAKFVDFNIENLGYDLQIRRDNLLSDKDNKMLQKLYTKSYGWFVPINTTKIV